MDGQPLLWVKKYIPTKLLYIYSKYLYSIIQTVINMYYVNIDHQQNIIEYNISIKYNYLCYDMVVKLILYLCNSLTCSYLTAHIISKIKLNIILTVFIISQITKIYIKHQESFEILNLK